MFGRSAIQILSLLVAAGILNLTILTPAAGGVLGESGPEIWVDGPLAVKPGNDPRKPAADTNRQGQQIYVWDSNGSGDGLDIYLRIFEPDGSPSFDPVLVNTFTEDDQRSPELAVSEDGTFLVVWQSFEPPEAGVNIVRIIIRSQAFDAAGSPVGTEQVLSIQTLIATDAGVDVEALPNGSYIVVWQSSQSANPADTGISIQGRLIGANGVPITDQFQVNALMSGAQESDPSVTRLADGGFLVAWVRPQVHARRFDASAVAQGDDFEVRTFDSNRNVADTSMGIRDNGDVLIAWADNEDGVEGSEIRGRLYNAALAAQGPDFRINTVTADAQTDPSVAGYGDGFFVVWESVSSVGADPDDSIEGRVVTDSNTFGTPQFLVNEFTTETQATPDIGGRDGKVAIAWFSRSNEETSQNVILGQSRNVCGIFCDSFE